MGGAVRCCSVSRPLRPGKSRKEDHNNMKSNNSKPNILLLAAGLCGLGLWAGSASAHGYAGEGAREQWALERAGARIERRYDRKGDRIERQLDVRARQLRYQGRYREARELQRLGDRIDHRLDRKGERLHRQVVRAGGRHHGGRDASWRHRDSHRHHQSTYCPPPRRVAVAPWPGYPRSGVTVAIDLGHWVVQR
jgi:hypothetical protein